MAMVECGVTLHLKLGCLFVMIFIDGRISLLCFMCVNAVSENFNDTFSPYWALFPGHRVFDYTHSAPLHT